MPWLQLRLDTDPDGVEALEDRMLATGAAAVTLQDNADQPVLEPGVGETPLLPQVLPQVVRRVLQLRRPPLAGDLYDQTLALRERWPVEL